MNSRETFRPETFEEFDSMEPVRPEVKEMRLLPVLSSKDLHDNDKKRQMKMVMHRSSKVSIVNYNTTPKKLIPIPVDSPRVTVSRRPSKA
jgi:hypothetical protein